MIKNKFHLAIPSYDLEKSIEYYRRLDCKLGRRDDNFAIFDFFGHQLVLHLSCDLLDKEPEMYPRHFGLCIDYWNDFNDLLLICGLKKMKFYKDLFVRYQGELAEHQAFFLIDSSKNLIEFKHYTHGTPGVFGQ